MEPSGTRFPPDSFQLTANKTENNSYLLPQVHAKGSPCRSSSPESQVLPRKRRQFDGHNTQVKQRRVSEPDNETARINKQIIKDYMDCVTCFIDDEMLGFLLGLNLAEMGNHMPGSNERVEWILTQAAEKNLLSHDQVLIALNQARGGIDCEQLSRKWHREIPPPDPECCKQPEQINLDDPLTARDAYLLFSNFNCVRLGAEMGLDGRRLLKYINSSRSYDNNKAYLLSELENEGLLTFRRYFVALRKLSFSSDNVIERLKIEIPVRAPDYQTGCQNRVQALTQKLSLRDFFVLAEPILQLDHLATHFGAERQLSYLSRSSEDSKHQLLIACYNARPDGISLNDMVRLLERPDLGRLKEARTLVSEATGMSVDQTAVSIYSVFFPCMELPEPLEFAVALGMPEEIRESLGVDGQGDNLSTNVLIEAEKRGLLTDGNLVFALYQIGRADIKEKIQELADVEPVPLGDQASLALTPEELGLIPVEEEPRSERLTLSHLTDIQMDHCWYWLGLAMGVSIRELELIAVNKKLRNSCAEEFRKRLVRMSSELETGHLYQALISLNDQTALRSLPTHFHCEPRKPLAEIIPRSRTSSTLINLAFIFKKRANELGLELMVPQYEIDRLLMDHSNEPERAVVKMVRYAVQHRSLSRRSLLDQLVNLATRLHFQEPSVETTMPAPVAPSAEEFTKMVQSAVTEALDTPDEFICPITQSVALDPVVVINGNGSKQVYERSAIIRWLKDHKTNPLTREPLFERDLQEASDIREKILAWLGSNTATQTSDASGKKVK